jgi:hypothetical protein
MDRSMQRILALFASAEAVGSHKLPINAEIWRRSRSPEPSLSPQQVAAIEKGFAGPKDSRGAQVYPGFFL